MENKDRISAELEAWLANPMTTRFRKFLLENFDHQAALMGSGATVDRLKGRAEVLEYVIDPKRLFELNS